MKKHCISYPTKSLTFCKISLFYKFICVYIVSFYVKLLKLEHSLVTVNLLSQNPTKKVMLLYKKILL